jgi:uncharacterized protein (TIGR02246 family)
MSAAPEQLYRAFQDAFNRRDLESMVALYEPDAVLAGVDRAVRGTDAIRERYRDILARHPSIDVQTLNVDVAGDLAMLHGKWILTERGPDGIPVSRGGRNAEVARRQPDGRWLFVIDIPFSESLRSAPQ